MAPRARTLNEFEHVFPVILMQDIPVKVIIIRLFLIPKHTIQSYLQIAENADLRLDRGRKRVSEKMAEEDGVQYQRFMSLPPMFPQR